LSIENVEALRFLREQYRIKGKGNLLLVWRILQTVKGYSVLTVRQLFYILARADGAHWLCGKCLADWEGKL
jgi:hypothetical protein